MDPKYLANPPKSENTRMHGWLEWAEAHDAMLWKRFYKSGLANTMLFMEFCQQEFRINRCLYESEDYTAWARRFEVELIKQWHLNPRSLIAGDTFDEFCQHEFEHNQLHYEPDNPGLLSFIPQNGNVRVDNIRLPSIS